MFHAEIELVDGTKINPFVAAAVMTRLGMLWSEDPHSCRTIIRMVKGRDVHGRVIGMRHKGLLLGERCQILPTVQAVIEASINRKDPKRSLRKTFISLPKHP